MNYKHLHYFWVVAKAGSIARASEKLHITPQTISGQLSLLEENLQKSLFSRVGRTLELTETGRLVLNYADEIFSLGGELEEMLHNLPENKPLLFKVGIADVVPKSIAYRLLNPALQLADPVRLICREGSVDSLLAQLASHKLDLVIADRPHPNAINIRGYNHPLGDCGVTFFASPQLASKLVGDFPQNINAMPLLLPGEMTVTRNQLIKWLDGQHIYPNIIGEFDDSALMKAFGQTGTGVFTSPTPIAEEVTKQYGVTIIGQTDEIREQFYAISVERKLTHPAVTVITETAREWLHSLDDSSS